MSTAETETTEAQEAAEVTDEAQEAKERAQEGAAERKSLSDESARKIQSENKALRVRLKEAEAKEAERAKAEMSDKERLEADLADRDGKLTAAEKELRGLRAESIAAELGFIDPELASPLLDWEQIDDPTDRKQIRDGLKKVLERKPHLARRGQGADGGAGRGQRGAGSSDDMNALMRDKVPSRR